MVEDDVAVLVFALHNRKTDEGAGFPAAAVAWRNDLFYWESHAVGGKQIALTFFQSQNKASIAGQAGIADDWDVIADQPARVKLQCL